MGKHLVVPPRVWLLAVLVFSATLLTSAARANEIEQILRGFEIAPVKLNLAGKDWALVGLGSYLVNTTGCNDCHTWPNWADGHNPYLPNQQREQINTQRYMAGGRVFLKSDGVTVLAVSANITPDINSRPAGLTWAGFREVMRTGHDPRDSADDILQVMPWPLYRWKTNRDLSAIYEYLRAIPRIPAN
jgi:hypothetical protein